MLALFAALGGGDLEKFLDGIFERAQRSTVSASETEIKTFNVFMNEYKKGLVVERLAGEVM